MTAGLLRSGKTSNIEREAFMEPGYPRYLEYPNAYLFSDKLYKKLDAVRNLKRREYVPEIVKFIQKKDRKKVLAPYGCKYTGKSVSILQSIADMSDEERKKTVFVQANKKMDFINFTDDVQRFYNVGYRNFYIDEINLVEQLLDHYILLYHECFKGAKFVLSDTNSLLLWLLFQEDEFLKRGVLIPTSFISFAEWNYLADVQPQKNIKNFLCNGGTVLRKFLPEFMDSDQYVFSAFTKNISHTLYLCPISTHFHDLIELTDSGFLQYIISLIVSRVSHNITLQTMEDRKIFKLRNDILTLYNKMSKKYLDNEKNNLMLKVKESLFAKYGRKIGDPNEPYRLTNSQRNDLFDALSIVNFAHTYPIRNFSIHSYKEIPVDEEYTAKYIVQPGLRFREFYRITDLFEKLTGKKIKTIDNGLLGNILEEQILNEFINVVEKNKLPYEIFKACFTDSSFKDVGEIDLILRDRNTGRSLLIESKMSDHQRENDAKNFLNEQINDILIDNEIYPIGRFVTGRMQSSLGLYGQESELRYECVNVAELLCNLHTSPFDTIEELFDKGEFLSKQVYHGADVVLFRQDKYTNYILNKLDIYDLQNRYGDAVSIREIDKKSYLLVKNESLYVVEPYYYKSSIFSSTPDGWGIYQTTLEELFYDDPYKNHVKTTERLEDALQFLCDTFDKQTQNSGSAPAM